jgi:hypothetical protein
MLSTLNSLQTTLDLLGLSSAAPLPILQQALTSADAAVKAYCHRDLEQQVYTEYRDGNNTDSLPLRQRPVTAPLRTGTLTNGAATVTGLAKTSDLLVGMPAVTGPGVVTTVLPIGTTILSVDSASQVTLSANSTASGSFNIVFGLAVWADPTGYGGFGPTAFAANTFLYEGQDYLMRREASSGSVSLSAVLVRLGGGTLGNLFDCFPGMGMGYGRRGTLTAKLPPVWPWTRLGLKICYCAGYSTSPTGGPGTGNPPVPADLIQAVNQVAAFMLRSGPKGGQQVTSESFIDYSYSIQALQLQPELGETRDLLSRFREFTV